ncbi:integrin alpha-PS3-like [Teleopsis dalmanni]|uniref:integrin alpha-PS3-like n=1 Tax=Teleopsis dalmanni TaxID=139649 RepID=UPI0018CD132B|nr:integrin alpha-PS3-like [Teleopsis dalmanni]
MFHKTNLFSSFYIIHLVSIWTCAFNLSPIPSLKIEDPRLTTIIEQTRSSYFGYTIVLREQSILIGAPRAQSTIITQSLIDETGAIYKCANSGKDPNCRPFIFDSKGNEITPNGLSKYNKTHQWLGASMAGGPKETDQLIVCAPGYAGKVDIMGLEPYMHGICYWTPDTLSNKPKNVKEFAFLRDNKNLQVKQVNATGVYFYQLGQQGFSINITPNNKEFLFGAPGTNEWRGSVIRYNKINGIVTISEINSDANANGGYAVASGYFDKDDHLNKKLLYVITLPHGDVYSRDAHSQLGAAFLFDYIEPNSINKTAEFSGMQYGEFFGYTVLAVDITGDGLDDILISAPLHSLNDLTDVGGVYVFLNKGRFKFSRTFFTSPFSTEGRFGTTMSSIGDINLDGYNDVAISAPFANKYGAVAIYLGGPTGLRNKPSQIIKLNQEMYINGMFGHGLSNGADIDDNGYNDLAIGAPNAEAVFVYKSFPVVKIMAEIRNERVRINVEDKNLIIQICYAFKTKSKTLNKVLLEIDLVVDQKFKRVNILDGENYKWSANKTVYLTKRCTSINASLWFSSKDVFEAIPIVLTYRLVNDGIKHDGLEFCDDCVVLDPLEVTMRRQFVRYIHGCINTICNVDLNVISENIPRYVMESTSSSNFMES